MITRAAIAGGVLVSALALVVLTVVVRYGLPSVPAATTLPHVAMDTRTDFLYGRITAEDGTVYEGRLRWGGDQEAFWDDHFNGAKSKNPWDAHSTRQNSPIEIFGIEFGGRDRRFDRQFLARFGDIGRVDAQFATVQVTLKSGTTFELDRFSAGDIDDGVRVWDRTRGVLDLDARDIRTIEFLPAPRVVATPDRLHGTVHTQHRDFTGFIQWNQRDALGTDVLNGRTADGDVSLPYNTIRSIARDSRDRALVTLLDGREVLLSETGEAGNGSRGIAVDDRRFGRVLVYWKAFERIDFTAGGSGPAYADFAPGHPLRGTVTARDGRRFAGSLVYDFDESETTDTLDAGSDGVGYTIPFGLIASIVPAASHEDTPRARVILRDGDALQLDRAGDLGNGNTGLLIFVDGRQRPEYVPWSDVKQVDLDRPPNGNR
jgi:hypothetical protein